MLPAVPPRRCWEDAQNISPSLDLRFTHHRHMLAVRPGITDLGTLGCDNEADPLADAPPHQAYPFEADSAGQNLSES